MNSIVIVWDWMLVIVSVHVAGTFVLHFVSVSYAYSDMDGASSLHRHLHYKGVRIINWSVWFPYIEHASGMKMLKMINYLLGII